MKTLIFNIRVWSFWLFKVRLYPTNKAWGNKLQKLIDEGTQFNLKNENRYEDGYYAIFGTEKLWIANMPYASFSLDLGTVAGEKVSVLPSKKVGYQLICLFNKAVYLEKQRLQNELL